MNYELFIGLRYLQARRRETFISLITVISVLGVMIGVMTLNVVMAVMSGFEETLRDRLLGINAHIALIRSGEPLRDYETVVKLIARTSTAKGLTVTCRLDRRKYPTGRKVTTEEMQQVHLRRGRFHGDWNYVIKPRRTGGPATAV